MAVNLSNVELSIVSELKISEDEAKVFLASLVGRGMVIEITNTEFESLHPRFAITNRYRRRCQEDNVPFKKNLKIDNIGIVLEQPYEDARTK